MSGRLIVTIACSLAISSAAALAQRAGAFGASRDHPAIAYSDGTVDNVVAALSSKIDQGSASLAFNPENGYLRSVLDALQVPVESQVLVFSETSFQARRIRFDNPRAIFFNDHVAVGWVRGGEVLELAVQDRLKGTVYYTVEQTNARSANFSRSNNCVSCHLSWETRAVPGPMVLSVHPRKSDREYANGTQVDHSTPIAERWGGWYVTGKQVPRHRGNAPLIQPDMPATGPVPVPSKPSVEGAFDLNGYPTPYSDVVALMLLEHQADATNLITRAGWEYRHAEYERRKSMLPQLAGPQSPQSAALPARVREAVEDLVDYLLFVDEAALPAPIRGSSGLAEKFAEMGPRDRGGRSLRQLDLDRRLLRYPCSYMVYSPGFDGLPAEVKHAVYRRISTVLSGREDAKKYAHLSRADRAAILAILRETTSDTADPLDQP